MSGTFHLRRQSFNPILLGLALALAPFVRYAAVAFDGFPILAGDLALLGQTNWNFYNAGDAPEGAYMGWLYPPTTSTVGVVNLNRTLPPGNYYLLLKVIDYMGPGRIVATAGGASAAVFPNNDDWNKYWTDPVLLRCDRAFTNLTINLLKTIPNTNTQKYLLRGLYLTTNASENVPLYGFDRIVDWTYPAALSTNAPVKGNLIADASFETGLGHGWGFLAEGYSREMAISSFWRTNDAMVAAYHGDACIRVPVRGSLMSRTHTLKANTFYTLSAWVRAPVPTGIGLGVYNVTTPPPGFSNVVNLYNNTLRATTNWNRVSVSGYCLDYPHCHYQLMIYANPGTEIDALQLEEGPLSDFSPAAPVEIGFRSNTPGRLFFDDEEADLALVARNNASTTHSGRLRYDVYDVQNRRVVHETRDLVLPVAQSVRQAISLPRIRGIFRIVAWIDDVPGTLEEVTYAMLPRPRTVATDVSSVVGVHPNLVPFQLAMHQRLGFKWARAMSPATVFRWAAIEPTPGDIRWFDQEITSTVSHGLTVLGTITGGGTWPAWADNSGLPDLDKWESFVTRLVAHYKDRVKYWEIWNEPIYVFTAQFYAELLKRAALAIRREDPSAKIVAMGGVRRDWMLQVIEALGPDWRLYADIVSTHIYPPGNDPSASHTPDVAMGFKRDLIDRYGVEVWNTETGWWDQGFYRTANSSYSALGEPMRPYLDSERFFQGACYGCECVLANLFHSTGNGLTKYFYYDSRIYATPQYLRSHPTILEFDDSIRAKGIAYAIGGRFLDGARGLGSVTPSIGTTYAYLFDGSAGPWVVLWSNDRLNHELTLSADVIVSDFMGNAGHPTNRIAFGRFPVYVQGAATTADALRAAIVEGRVTDVADTLAPNLSLDEFPTGPISQPDVALRWTAIDETSIPCPTEPNAVTYSCRLEGRDADWSAWTPGTEARYSQLTAGNYVFQVQAKDAAGNLSEIRGCLIVVIPPLNAPPRRPAGLRPMQN